MFSRILVLCFHAFLFRLYRIWFLCFLVFLFGISLIKVLPGSRFRKPVIFPNPWFYAWPFRHAFCARFCKIWFSQIEVWLNPGLGKTEFTVRKAESWFYKIEFWFEVADQGFAKLGFHKSRFRQTRFYQIEILSNHGSAKSGLPNHSFAEPGFCQIIVSPNLGFSQIEILPELHCVANWPCQFAQAE